MYKTEYTLSQNEVAYFIHYSARRFEAFETVEERDAVVAEIEADDYSWNHGHFPGE